MLHRIPHPAMRSLYIFNERTAYEMEIDRRYIRDFVEQPEVSRPKAGRYAR